MWERRGDAGLPVPATGRRRPSPPHQHDGAEFIYLIEGQLVVDVGGNDLVLEEGDAMYFDSSAPDSYRRESCSVYAAIVVVASQ